MAQLIGQIYNPELYLRDKEGNQIKFNEDNWEEKLQTAEKATFQCTIGTRKAFINEDDKKHFTEIVAFQKGLVKVLYKNFGKAEHKGKWAVLYGAFNTREWTPDVNKSEHLKYCKKETLYKEDLEALGFKFGEGSPAKVSFYVPIPQTVEQLVVNNFEFVGDYAPASTTESSSESTGRKSNVRFVADDSDDQVPAGAKQDGDPF